MISLMSWGDKVPDTNADRAGYVAMLFADTKAEVLAEDEVVATANAGEVLCLPGSSCITKLGEVLIVDSAGVWGEI